MFESDEELHQRLFYIRVDADGEMIEPTYIDPQNIYYIMGSSWDFTLEEILTQGFAPVLESNATFTNGDNIIETTFGDLVRDADTGVFTQEYIHAEISDWEKRQRFVERTRVNLLFQSDWTQVADSPLSDAVKAEWTTYRQALRDLPATIDYSTLTNADDVTWPLLPGTALPAVEGAEDTPVDQPL